MGTLYCCIIECIISWVGPRPLKAVYDCECEHGQVTEGKSLWVHCILSVYCRYLRYPFSLGSSVTFDLRLFTLFAAIIHLPFPLHPLPSPPLPPASRPQDMLGEPLLKERLDMEALEASGLVPSKINFNQKYVKTKTKLL